MSGETDKQVSGWTVDTLKEYTERRFTDQDKAVQAALLAAKEAVIKAELATEKRFEATNEFRGQLADQTATLMPRQEADSRFNSLGDKITEIAERINKTEGRSSGFDKSWAIFLALVGLVGLAVGLVSK